jgi:hypothetical protein
MPMMIRAALIMAVALLPIFNAWFLVK